MGVNWPVHTAQELLAALVGFSLYTGMMTLAHMKWRQMSVPAALRLAGWQGLIYITLYEATLRLWP